MLLLLVNPPTHAFLCAAKARLPRLGCTGARPDARGRRPHTAAQLPLPLPLPPLLLGAGPGRRRCRCFGGGGVGVGGFLRVHPGSRVACLEVNVLLDDLQEVESELQAGAGEGRQDRA